MALALDTNRVKPTTLFDTGNGRFVVGDRTIRDTHAHGVIDVSTIIQKSSNIGVSKMALAMPAETDPLVQVARSLSALAQRDERRRFIQRIIERAGLDLTVASTWLLVRLEENPQVELADLAEAHSIELEKLQTAFADLSSRKLIVGSIDASPLKSKRGLTKAGCRVFNQLMAARREHLAELWPHWSPETRDEVARLIRRLTREPIPETEASADPVSESLS